MGKLIVQAPNKNKNNNANQNKTVKKPPIKKKKHGCLGCLGGLLAFVLIIVVGGYFAGDYFSKQYLGMGLADCGKVLKDIRTINTKTLVTNKYDPDADLTALESELKKQLFLKQDVKLTISDLVNAIMPKGEESTTPKNLLNNELTKTIHTLNANGADEKVDGIIDFVGDLYKIDNIDKARLNAYDEQNHNTDYVFKITDKELAALIYNSQDMLIDKFGASLKSTLAQFGIEDYKKIFSIEQIILDELDGKIAGVEAKVPVLKLTISLDIRAVAKNIIIKKVGADLSVLSNMLLPTRLYVTAQIGINPAADTLDSPLYINNMDDAAMDRIYKIVSGVTKMMGAEINLKTTINDAIGTAMKSMGSFLDMIIDNKVADHAIKIDLFDTIINYSGLNKNADGTEKEEANCLSPSDIIKTLGGIVTSDVTNAINTDHAYDHQHYDSATNKVVYDAASTDTANLVDYKKEFLDEIASKYMLNLRGADDIENTADDITFDDIMALFGIGTVDSGKQIELLDLLDPKKLDSILNMPSPEVGINDRMMGAILNSQISTLMAGDGSLSKMEPKLEYVIVTAKDGHNFIEMGLSVKIASMLGDVGAGFGDIISGLIGDKIVLIVKMDVTPQSEPIDPAFKYVGTEIKYNDLTVDKTNTILGTINKFGVAFDVSELLGQLETPVRDAINKMGSILPIKLMDSSVISDVDGKNLPTAIQLPTVFSTIDEMLFKDDEGDKINADGIKEVLRGIDVVNKTYANGKTYEEEHVKPNAAKDYQHFSKELQNNYYINPNIDPITKEELPFSFDDLFGAGGIADSGSFNADKFNFDGAKGLFYDTTAADKLAPVFEDRELAALLVEKMKENVGTYGDIANIQRFDVTADGKLTLIIKLEIAKLLGDANADKLSLLPADTLYLTASIDTSKELTSPSGKKYYATNIQINNMGATTDILIAMIEHLTKGSGSLNLKEKANDIGAMVYDQLGALNSSLGQDAIKFVDGGIQLPVFYDFLVTALNLENVKAEDFKGALQGLMAYDATKSKDNIYNYKSSEIVTNPIIPDERSFIELIKDVKNIDYMHYNVIRPDTLPPIPTKAEVWATDNYLGNLLTGINTKDFSLEQVNIVGFKDGKGDIKFTFKMTGFSVGTSGIASKLPQEMYVTMSLTYDNNNKQAGYTNPTFTINSLNTAQQNVIFSIIGTGAMTQIDTQIDEVIKLLNSYFEGAEYGVKDDAKMPAKFTKEFNGYIKYTVNI